MTWKELCAKAKELGYELNTYDDIIGFPKQELSKNTPEGRLSFYEDGVVMVVANTEQMYQIMEALK